MNNFFCKFTTVFYRLLPLVIIGYCCVGCPFTDFSRAHARFSTFHPAPGQFAQKPISRDFSCSRHLSRRFRLNSRIFFQNFLYGTFLISPVFESRNPFFFQAKDKKSMDSLLLRYFIKTV